ncbi:uncharacterized protein RHO17_016436 [Thomomys bottae]
MNNGTLTWGPGGAALCPFLRPRAPPRPAPPPRAPRGSPAFPLLAPGLEVSSPPPARPRPRLPNPGARSAPDPVRRRPESTADSSLPGAALRAPRLRALHRRVPGSSTRQVDSAEQGGGHSPPGTPKRGFGGAQLAVRGARAFPGDHF